VLIGNSAPDTIHMGTRSRFIIAWKPEVVSIRQAITNPMPVSVNAMRKIAAITDGSSSTETETPASGANKRNRRPWIQARVAEPRIFPKTNAVRGAGETSIERRKPSRRSSMIDIVEKMAENITVRTNAPE